MFQNVAENDIQEDSVKNISNISYRLKEIFKIQNIVIYIFFPL